MPPSEVIVLYGKIWVTLLVAGAHLTARIPAVACWISYRGAHPWEFFWRSFFCRRHPQRPRHFLANRVNHASLESERHLWRPHTLCLLLMLRSYLPGRKRSRSRCPGDPNLRDQKEARSSAC